MQSSFLPILSYKQAFNYKMEDKLLRTTQFLAAQLDILDARDRGLLAGEDITERTLESTKANQQEFIKQAIEDIIDIRERFGITEVKGQNKPLEELFKIDTKV